MIAVGVSFGGILLGNYASDRNDHATNALIGGMLISPSFDPHVSNASLRKPGLNSILCEHLTDCLIETVKSEEHLFTQLTRIDLKQIYNCKTIWDFDKSYTCPAFGFPDIDDYYKKTQLIGKLGQVTIPILSLNAEDDIFTPLSSLPFEEAAQSDFVAILTTKYGGHMAFLEGFWPSSQDNFANKVFQQFVQTILKMDKIK